MHRKTAKEDGQRTSLNIFLPFPTQFHCLSVSLPFLFSYICPFAFHLRFFQCIKYTIYYFQAVRCILWGLEDFADDPNVACHITDIVVGKALVASVKSLPSAKNPAVGVVLYDTSTEEDLNLNTMLLDCISKDAVAPQLPAVSSTSVQIYLLSEEVK